MPVDLDQRRARHREANRRWATSHGRRLARRRRYGALFDAALCVDDCGRPAESGHVRCDECHGYHERRKDRAV